MDGRNEELIIIERTILYKSNEASVRRLILIVFTLLLSLHSFSQRAYGVEYQHGFGKSYHSNSIGTLIENYGYQNTESLHFVAHYTWDIFKTNKKSRLISDFGLSVGYRKGFNYGRDGNALGGIRVTLSHIIKKDHRKITASLELGYHNIFKPTGTSGGFITPSIAIGYDFPIGKAKAEDFKGVLFIPRISVGYRSYQ